MPDLDNKLRGARLHMAISDAIDLIRYATKEDLKRTFKDCSRFDIEMEVLNPLLSIQTFLDKIGIKNPEKELEKLGRKNGRKI